MYTVGQRSGLRLQASGPASPPRYVSRIDATTNTVVVGGADQLRRSTCRLEDVRYVTGRVPTAAFRASVKVRSHAPVAAALVTPLREQARIDFDERQRAMAPGQAAVFYHGDRVIGGGPIAAGDV
jgi:tRNA-specific 2-thiouridylase